MRPRKCEISNADGELFPASFHGFFSDGRGGVCAIIERKNGSVEKCDVEDVHFLEQEHPRVRVHSDLCGAKEGEFHGWATINNTARGIVRFDDGTCDTAPVNAIQFQSREVSNE